MKKMVLFGAAAAMTLLVAGCNCMEDMEKDCFDRDKKPKCGEMQKDSKDCPMMKKEEGKAMPAKDCPMMQTKEGTAAPASKM